jgi:uncharacterized protein YkwD
MATARAEDGWIVLAVILLEPPRPRPAPVPAEIEAGTVEAINAIRTARDLVALELDPALTDVARAHSRDMIRRGYFDHDAPDGNAAADRVRQSGLPFDRVGENLHRSNGAKDPVGTAVRSWMDSPGHRALVLEPAFRTTGVGVAVDDDGTVYFTQLFLAPDPRPVPGPGR